jgi:hypothetical protein
MPKAVQARIARRERAERKRARTAARDPVSRAAGCVPSQFPHELGPPLPRLQARLIGRHAELVFHYRTLPRSRGCRPWGLTVAVFGSPAANATSSVIPSVTQFVVAPPAQGRVVVSLPFLSRAPYRFAAFSVSMFGRRGPKLEQTLKCSPAGCIPGPTFTGPQPRPLLPLVGIDRAQLQASLAFVVHRQRLWPPRRVVCPSLARCEITYVDPLYPSKPFRVGYRVSGEQPRGCWMALSSGPLDPLPYADVRRGQNDLAGCLSWGTLPK